MLVRIIHIMLNLIFLATGRHPELPRRRLPGNHPAVASKPPACSPRLQTRDALAQVHACFPMQETPTFLLLVRTSRLRRQVFGNFKYAA